MVEGKKPAPESCALPHTCPYKVDKRVAYKEQSIVHTQSMLLPGSWPLSYSHWWCDTSGAE